MSTHTMSALRRYREHGIDRNPGQDVQYVVVDDDAREPERVRLPFEEPDSYDADVYTKELVRAGESIVSPLGWDRIQIQNYLNQRRDTQLQSFH